jgi:NAD(P)-dependent dehydrogenase (short-subunit alcohol dehydrogenase family)
MAAAFPDLTTPAYKISKAALNMLTVQYAQQYVDDGFTFLAISPGVSQPYSLLIASFSNFTNIKSGFGLTLVAIWQIFRLK